MNHRYGRAAIIGIALASVLHEANKPRSLATLPNHDGFRFTGHKLDGTKVQCVVRRGPSAGGFHEAHTLDGRHVFRELVAWSPEEL